VISCGVALAVAGPLDAPSSCFLLAIMVSNLDGDKGPGFLSVGLSALAFAYFFLPPLFHLLSIEPFSYLRFSAFLGAALLVTGLIQGRRRVEESRRAINALYWTIADTAPDAIISIDGSNLILFMNPAAPGILWLGRIGTHRPTADHPHAEVPPCETDVRLRMDWPAKGWNRVPG
jgi:PAS domain-containing protein